MKILIVGGSVRDIFLGTVSRDSDYLVIDGTKEEFLEKFPNAKEVGKAHTVYLVGRSEYSFPRGGSIENDLRLRDLTINAMALGDAGKLYHHPQALKDIELKVLRPASAQSFFEDPLRVFRAARFFATLNGFSVHKQLLLVMSKASQENLLESIAAERVGQEMLIVMADGSPGRFFSLLSRTNCLRPWFSELADLRGSGPSGKKGNLEIHFLPTDGRHTTRFRRLTNWLALAVHLPDKFQVQSLSDKIRLPLRFKKAGCAAKALFADACRYNELDLSERVHFLRNLHSSSILAQLLRVVQLNTGKRFNEVVERDMQAFLSVNLPPDLHNMGAGSGKALHELRIKALEYAAKEKPIDGDSV
ncbi:MAG: hypothetical protein ACNI27_07975 [Desulfovibrio sp.]